jgi:hypothetical protein
LEDYFPSLSQDLFHFAEIEYPVICFDLKVYRYCDGAFQFTSLVAEFLIGVIAWVSLSHSGGHGFKLVAAECKT